MKAIPKTRLVNELPTCLRQDTDTVHPHTPIPIFYIHGDLPTPFCTNPACFCQRSKHDAAKLLGDIAEGTFFLRNAATLMENEQGEKEL